MLFFKSFNIETSSVELQFYFILLLFFFLKNLEFSMT
jgi:hypothetical protein